MSLKTCREKQERLRPLCKQEIDRRIETLVADVASLVEEDETSEGGPCWISASELVIRMRPFIVWN